jgi:hypothetical protein
MGKGFKDFDVCKAFKHKNKEKLLNLIFELYDQKSPFNSIASIMDRKKSICEKVGLNVKDPDVLDILEMKNTEFNNLVYHYASFYKCSNTFQQMMTDQNLFWGIQKVLSQPVEYVADEETMLKKYKQRGELSELSDKAQKRINGYLTEMYKDDEEMKEVASQNIRSTQSLEMWLQQQKESQDVQTN